MVVVMGACVCVCARVCVCVRVAVCARAQARCGVCVLSSPSEFFLLFLFILSPLPPLPHPHPNPPSLSGRQALGREAGATGANWSPPDPSIGPLGEPYFRPTLAPSEIAGRDLEVRPWGCCGDGIVRAWEKCADRR